MAATLSCLSCRHRFARARGLCANCYPKLNARVRSGKVTWQQLEREGQAAPLTLGKPGSNWRRRRACQ